MRKRRNRTSNAQLGFEQFIAPIGFTKPEQWFEYGLEVNMLEKFAKCSHPDKKFIALFSPSRTSESFTPYYGTTHLVFETINGVETQYSTLSTTITWTSGSIKRYIIFCNTVDLCAANIGGYAYYFNTSQLCPTGSTTINTMRFIFVNKLSAITNTNLHKNQSLIPNSVINIPTNVNYILDGAFSGMSASGIITVNFSDSVLTTGNQSFSANTNLKNVVLPPNLYSIGFASFRNSTGIQTVTFNNALTTTSAGSAFQGCSALQSIDLPASLVTVGASTFLNCTALTSIKINCPNATYGTTPFGGCTNVTSLYLPVDYSSTYNDWSFSAKLALTNATADILAQSIINVAAGSVGNIKTITIGATNITNLNTNCTPSLLTTMNNNLTNNYKQLA